MASTVMCQRATRWRCWPISPSRAACIHVKDACVVDPASGLTAWMPVGAGQVDLQGQLGDLVYDGFRGPVVLETHWRGEGLTREQSSRRSFAGLLDLIHRVQH